MGRIGTRRRGGYMAQAKRRAARVRGGAEGYVTGHVEEQYLDFGNGFKKW